MMSFGPFKAEHLTQLTVQDAQRWTLKFMSPALLKTIEAQWSNTVFRDGQPICCGGVIEQRPDYGILWSFVGSDVTPQNVQWIKGDEKALVLGTVDGEWPMRPSTASEAAAHILPEKRN